ncbi:zinc metallopeptidase [Aeoliella mucimassa]|uniref:Neutral zinc metallopeptidase n=1 Tax=Aeoliella mucimassa TaxID=2527972 RepID=A0A518AJP3_9BACT|nr:zinc metallopeptidase [Aeoliella mucimassa]QDU54957.1 Putative neutral zinc metallopeptidase [Aeoliella mucimassa]
MFLPFDPLYLLMLAPAMLLAFWAQARVQSNYQKASRVRARLSGKGAARLILDSAGLHDVPIEPIAGQMTDHYDPSHKVLRLSQGVYDQPSMAAVGIAAHEAGHAIQDARHYAPLVIRNLAVPAGQFGGSFGMLTLMAGLVLSQLSTSGGGLGSLLCIAGMVMFAAVVVFQLINLPVEFDASARAKRQLVEHQIVSREEMHYINGVLNSAALTYVAATAQAVLTLVYLLIRFGGGRDE